MIQNVGITLEKNIIEKLYKEPQVRQVVKFNEQTDFEKGLIAFDDAIFLPENTYVLVKEKGQKDKLGKILHYKPFLRNMSYTPYCVAIVDINYDMTLSHEEMELQHQKVLFYVKKDIYGIYHNTPRMIQIVQYVQEPKDIWKFVRVEYGNPNTKTFYMYGWQHKDGEIYSDKKITSAKLSCCQNYYPYRKITLEEFDNTKQTNIEYKISPDILFVPYEVELYIVCLVLCFVFIIFEQRFILWALVIGFMLYKRKQLRSKYNL